MKGWDRLTCLSGCFRANVDEHYISQIITGLYGSFNFAGKDPLMEVKKVYPVCGIQVDMALSAKCPGASAADRTLQIQLAFSDEVEAVQVAQGLGYSTNQGNWIFKLSEMVDRIPRGYPARQTESRQL